MVGVFVKHTSCDKCGSSDGLAVYEDNSKHCWVCGFTVPSEEYKKSKEEKPSFGLKDKGVKLSAIDTKVKAVITEEQREEIKRITSIKGNNFRGINDDTNKYFGIRYEYNLEGDEVTKQYYPVTVKNDLSGYKIREVPKKFYSKGNVGVTADLFGQFRFTRGGRDVIIVGGETDVLSAYQMFQDYRISKGKDHYDPIAVVSPTIGETGCSKQIAAQYNFFDNFERIIIGFDNDEAGRLATEEIIKVLPKGKAYVCNWRYKDPNEYIQKGKESEFIKDFYNMKKYIPAGIVGSNELYDALLAKADMVKVTLPNFLCNLQGMMAGGIPLKSIVNFLAGSGIGKSTIVNSMVHHWITTSPYKVGVVSLEADCAEYANDVLSHHLSRKLKLIEDPQELKEYLRSEEVIQKSMELFNNEDGSPRFYVVDDRGDTESVTAKIEELIISCGVQIIIIDPISDAMAGMSLEQQELMMKWMKEMIKAYDVTFINVCHTRKGASGNTASRGADLSEEDIIGSSTIYKSAAANITLVRNKHAENAVVRNTTRVTMTKCRWTGNTGVAGGIYYDNVTSTLIPIDLQDEEG
jgi:twinkle protein